MTATIAAVAKIFTDNGFIVTIKGHTLVLARDGVGSLITFSGEHEWRVSNADGTGFGGPGVEKLLIRSDDKLQSR